MKSPIPASLFNRKEKILFIIAIVLIILLAIGWWKFVHLDEAQAEAFLHRFPLQISALIFVGIYVFLTTFIWFGLGNFFRIAAVMVYGPYLSTLFFWAGEMINLVIMFSLSRKLGRRFVESKLKKHLARMDEATKDLSFSWLFFLRFFPVVPFRFMDLALGLTNISLGRYFLIAALASPVRIFWIQFFLSKGLQNIKDPMVLADYLVSDPVIFWINFLYLCGALVLFVVLTVRTTKRVRQTLKTKSGS